MQAEQIDRLNQAVQQQRWSDALSVYQAWLVEGASGASRMPAAERQHHLRNVDELHKHVFYGELKQMAGDNARLHNTLERFCGRLAVAPENARQQPSFLYMPLGRQDAWFDSQSLLKPSACQHATIARLQQMARRVALDEQRFERYLDHFDAVPEAADWVALRQRWSSLHLMKNGQRVSDDPASRALLATLSESFALADCPPHAPEVFFSRLEPGGAIPPHYGLSNIKLTVHLPVVLHNSSSSLSVAGEQRFWQEGALLAFDDSFLHQASNPSDKERVVLIFDVWHPAIHEAEKPFLRELCARFQRLSDDMTIAQRYLGDSSPA
jgi:hypothetical protein